MNLVAIENRGGLGGSRAGARESTVFIMRKLMVRSKFHEGSTSENEKTRKRNMQHVHMNFIGVQCVREVAGGPTGVRVGLGRLTRRARRTVDCHAVPAGWCCVGHNVFRHCPRVALERAVWLATARYPADSSDGAGCSLNKTLDEVFGHGRHRPRGIGVEIP